MSRFDLRGRLVIVTGASSGLGRAIALRLAEVEGADVILAARRADRLQTLADQIASAGRTAHVVPVDLADPQGPAALIDRAWQVANDASPGAPDGKRDGSEPPGRAIHPFGLVNNAGVTEYGSFRSLGATALGRIIDLNVRGTMELTRLFVQRVSSSPAAGTEPSAAVLTIASIAAFTPVPYQAVYAGSKHALLGFGESIAAELAPSIAVTTFCPGGIATELVESSGISDSVGRTFLAPPDRVADWAIRAWRRGRMVATAGIENRLLRLFVRLLPARFVARRSERFFAPDDGK